MAITITSLGAGGAVKIVGISDSNRPIYFPCNKYYASVAGTPANPEILIRSIDTTTDVVKFKYADISSPVSVDAESLCDILNTSPYFFNGGGGGGSIVGFNLEATQLQVLTETQLLNSSIDDRMLQPFKTKRITSIPNMTAFTSSIQVLTPTEATLFCGYKFVLQSTGGAGTGVVNLYKKASQPIAGDVPFISGGVSFPVGAGSFISSDTLASEYGLQELDPTEGLWFTVSANLDYATLTNINNNPVNRELLIFYK